MKRARSLPPGALDPGDRDERYEAHKNTLRQELVANIDFEQLAAVEPEKLRRRLRMALERIIHLRTIPFGRMEREQVIEEILDDLIGLGPLEPLLKDPGISDIMINGPSNVFIERRGKLSETSVRFEHNEHLMQVIERIVAAVGRRVDDQHPMVDARMKDGSRFNAIIPPLALDGPCISIRRFGTVPITADDLVRYGSCPEPVLEVLRGCVKSRLNLIISGGTGSGKTTLLNVMSRYIPESQRIITIEDSAELQLQQEHLVRLETRPANLEGKGKIDQRDLVRNALRMRPDRIILGEIRGGEAVDMLTAMNTGCSGSLATVHANNPRDALARFETMVGIGMPNMSDKVIRETIARALDVVVQQERLHDGTRRIVEVCEVTGMEGPHITTQSIFKFDQETIDEDGKVRGRFRATGTKPRFRTRLAAFGIELNDELFQWELEV